LQVAKDAYSCLKTHGELIHHVTEKLFATEIAKKWISYSLPLNGFGDKPFTNYLDQRWHIKMKIKDFTHTNRTKLLPLRKLLSPTKIKPVYYVSGLTLFGLGGILGHIGPLCTGWWTFYLFKLLSLGIAHGLWNHNFAIANVCIIGRFAWWFYGSVHTRKIMSLIGEKFMTY